MIARASLSDAFHRERDCTNKSKQSGVKELRAFSPAETSRKARLRLLYTGGRSGEMDMHDNKQKETTK
jgi:hypothetical protein